MYRTVVIVVLMCCIADYLQAQQTPSKADSSNMYKNIETYSKRSRFSKFIYQLIFRPVNVIAPATKLKVKVKPRPRQKPYSAFQGKVIRNITIVTLDPFGYTIGDTIKARMNFIIRSGNVLHIKSLNNTIRNLLLIHQNQIFDSLLVKESERLVRAANFVQDVSFYVLNASSHSDSVDIYIRELDKWSIVPRFGASDSKLTFVLSDKNFLGFGHDFQNGFTWYHTNGENAYYTNYYIPNIRNTYINATIHYGTDEFRNFTKSVAIDRPFFSPYAHWAAGFNFTQQLNRDSIQISDSLSELQNFKFNMQDYWAGNAVQIFKGNSEYRRTTNLITTLRYYQINYLEQPAAIFDTLKIYSDEQAYMGSIGISTRRYVQDKYIFKYGITEDVPNGSVYNLTGGYFVKNKSSRFYLSVRISAGKYHSWGYLSYSAELSSYFKASDNEYGAFTFGLNYFTNLFESKQWKFRLFAKPRLIIGIKRQINEAITLNDGAGIDGFSSDELVGSKRMLLTIQVQSYAPWDIVGFHLGPYFNCSLGMLGDDVSGFKSSRLYSQFGLGLLIKNENLIINTFQFSVSYYPIIPGNGQNIFKVNAFRTNDFGFRDFEIGKPSVTSFE